MKIFGISNTGFLACAHTGAQTNLAVERTPCVVCHTFCDSEQLSAYIRSFDFYLFDALIPICIY